MLVINIYLILQAYNYMFMQSIQNALHELFKKKNPYQDVFQHFSNHEQYPKFKPDNILPYKTQTYTINKTNSYAVCIGKTKKWYFITNTQNKTKKNKKNNTLKFTAQYNDCYLVHY